MSSEEKGAYRNLVNPKLKDELRDKILEIIIINKKYRDKNYSAKQLALDLNTTTRYISAVVNSKFNVNYSSFINKLRIEEAMSILADKKYKHLRVEEVSDMVGFSNRQSFYTSFLRINGVTPKEYKRRFVTT